MLATSARSLVLLLLSGAALFADAMPGIHPTPELVAATATVPIYAHTEPPAQRVGHTLLGRQETGTTVTTRPLNDPSSVSSLLSQLSTATDTSASTTNTTATSSSSSIPFASIGSEPTDFGSSIPATPTAKAGGGGNGAAVTLSVGSVRVGVILTGALAAYMALA